MYEKTILKFVEILAVSMVYLELEQMVGGGGAGYGGKRDKMPAREGCLKDY